MENLINKTFDQLTVIALIGSDHLYNRMWICKCSCGKYTISTTSYLHTNNRPHSCGCKRSPNVHAPRLSMRTCIVCGAINKLPNPQKFCSEPYCQQVKKIVLYLSNQESIKRSEYAQSGTLKHHYCTRCGKIASPNISLCPTCLFITAKEKADARQIPMAVSTP